jgi:chromosomal replication initiator protein
MSHDRDAVVTYISSETFTNELIRAVEEAQLEEFRERYRSVDVLLVDDIQFIGKQETTQEEFFHTFNSLYNANKQIIIVSDRPPKDIPTLEKRLRSRFEGGLITDIKPPDQGTRALILKNKAEKDNISIPPEVLTLLATSIRSNIRTLIGALNKVSAYANLSKKDLTVEMAKEVLGDVLEEEAKLAESGGTQTDAPTMSSPVTSKPVNVLAPATPSNPAPTSTDSPTTPQP